MAPRSASEKVRPKKSYLSSACEYVKLPFSLKVPKNIKHNFVKSRIFIRLMQVFIRCEFIKTVRWCCCFMNARLEYQVEK
jgi:hypothetical protein